ncbi:MULTISPECIES: gamma-glutamylcyclotransferase family protein [unclassified Leeuwenhoekiella]|uniref:gamma-glutamylcyclotransferase family protein n=1 Tax=unclassified Leeuwenhoekiella TaxID=2615029 RepID=UPI000C502FD5|nr:MULTISPECIES: gamma-glutamylcyclotransferase family protein [unclassified Leeuwenhoekiella]MAW94156.1 hypothetical protein [Leeuwenhoekiella sp.]MBA82453.1 hypothetical protein [Leeuwenhoekiella sp.]|tara:strand:- start:67783 stop:68124 length:342 start_codon:yes stop_codon:yes gene_type:complete
METVQLFSYGTLQNGTIQQSLFKRRLDGTTEVLSGYILANISLPENHPQAKTYFIAIYTGNKNDTIEGVCYKINISELPQVDNYEGPAYERVQVILESGKKALVYRKPINKKY